MILLAKFTVLMAVYYKDNPLLFDAALNSVYTNSHPPAEVIVVQDGPVGETILDVLKKYESLSNFKCIRLPENRGLANALNIGLKHTTNEFVFRADADDINVPNRFYKQLILLMEGYDITGGSILEIDRMGHPIGIRKLPRTQQNIKKFIKKRNPFNHMTVAFRLSAVQRVGGYPNIHLKEDYGLWALMLSSGSKAMNTDDILVHATAGRDMYRRRGGIKYISSEYQLQKLLVSLGLQTLTKAVIIGVLRSAVFLMPAAVRGFIYERFLRDGLQTLGNDRQM